MLKRWGWGGDAGRGWAASPLRSDRQQSAQQAGPAREIGLRPHLSILESKGRGVNLWASEGHRGGNMSKEIRVRKQRAGAVAPRSPREMAYQTPHTPLARWRQYKAAWRRNLVGLVREGKGNMGMDGIFMKLQMRERCRSKSQLIWLDSPNKHFRGVWGKN